MRKPSTHPDRIAVVWALPSRLIGQIGPVPDHVQLDVISTAWALLRRVRGQPCHLLLINWELPDSTGPALAARIRILHSDLPIVLTTDRADLPEVGMDLGSLRVIGPLQMPVYWPHLLERVGAAARGREAIMPGARGTLVPEGRRHVLQ
ncbi:MAG: hypothetical protein JXQ73_21995 [Phycisphaerae bacterium]|nr:hypothetical protein [Phycisphaerae bacterium]